MSNGRGLKIVRQLLANANIKEQHVDTKAKRTQTKPKLSGESANLRYIRTPENDARFKAGETYLDTETGRIRWVPTGRDPNQT